MTALRQSFLLQSKKWPLREKLAVIPNWNWKYGQNFTFVFTVKGNVYKPQEQ
jgi:hypothetical protein